MPRVTKSPPVFLALSPAGVATALGVRPEIIQAAVADGSLKVYRCGIKSRILTSDVEAYVRSTWPEKIARTKRSPHVG